MENPISLYTIFGLVTEMKQRGHAGFTRRFLYGLRDAGLPLLNGRTSVEGVLRFVDQKLGMGPISPDAGPPDKVNDVPLAVAPVQELSRPRRGSSWATVN
jgi:hypothetical protein